MSMPPTLLWHRSDLRLADNAALTAAAEASSGAVVGVVVLPEHPYEPAILARPPQDGAGTRPPDRTASHARAARLNIVPGVTRTSPRRLGHWLQAIDELGSAWEQAGSALYVLRGDPGACIPALANALGVRQVHTAPCPAFDERRENVAVAHGLAASGGTLHVHDETTMLAANDLPFSIDALPDVFSNFRRLVEKKCRIREPLQRPSLAEMPAALRTMAAERTHATLADGVFAEARAAAQAVDPRETFTCHGGRSHGLARIARWFWQTDCIARYKETRDGLLGNDFSSRLSPWLSTGAISPREVAAEIRRYEVERTANDSTYWLFFELLWRDYFHFWVRRWRGRAFKASGVLGRTPCGSQDQAAFHDWCAGTTGEPFIDASMRELRTTGQLSNRARQNVASWLAKTAGIDWRWGAAWFESQLIDFDVGPNWGNWQYVAGVGNDPRNRTFHVQAQADRYDGDGAYRRLWGTSPTAASTP
ncbi:MAG: DASH family cryptochrome [Planctomycetes bacterium]|nr:DASH family cryptochrome [Planctomycetota bacterium]